MIDFRPRVAASGDPRGRVLVLFCHPVPHRSRVNAALRDAIAGIAGVTVHDLYEAWPDGLIDADFERSLLLAHEHVVLQHPFYWYSTPALLKEWQDQVLTYGWAYGPGGDRLRGKTLLSAITTGGSSASYRPGGAHDITVRELLAPIAQTARLCGMRYWPPLVVHGALALEPTQLVEAASDYRRVLEALRDGVLEPAETLVGNLDAGRAVAAGGRA